MKRVACKQPNLFCTLKGYSEGLTALWERGRLDITMEALVLKKPWTELFTEEDLSVARKRLYELGYKKT